jgi:hypothetical protein
MNLILKTVAIILVATAALFFVLGLLSLASALGGVR